MSHVDDGTLHAYLDGELPPVERERVDAHLRGCPACQARLAAERALIERAGRLLALAAPPERATPPLEQLRQPRLGWRLRRPLAWAATVVLAVGLGWYARGMIPGRAARDLTATPSADQGKPAVASVPVPALPESGALAIAPQAHLAPRARPRAFDTAAKDRDGQQLAAAGATGAVNALQAQESTAAGAPASQKTDAVTRLPTPAPAGVTVREGRAAAEPQSNIYIDGAPAPARRAAALLTTSWPLIARQPAREMLGVEPAVIPGFIVRAYRRNPASQEIAVEQVTDAGTTISLIESRVGPAYAEAEGYRADSTPANLPRAMAKAVNERLARFVGPLRIEIDGPLTPDSLSRLLELAR